MGRKKLSEESKKTKISIIIDKLISNQMDNAGVKKKSQFINWLLKEHFNCNVK